jgi:hypothetical protein
MRTRAARTVAVVLLSAALGEAPSSASEPCAASLADWTVVRGSLRATPQCGSYVAFTDGDSGVFSYGDFIFAKRVRAPLEVEVSWRRLGPETSRSLELRGLGALILVRDGEYGLYEWNEAAFEWKPLPGYREHDEHRVLLRQTETTISFFLDGRAVDSWQLAARGDGHVGVAAKGATGYRSAFSFRDFRVSSQ